VDDHNKQPGQSDYNQSEAPGEAATARTKLSDTADDVKEKVADFGRHAADSIDSSRQSPWAHSTTPHPLFMRAPTKCPVPPTMPRI
jgi:hypothetical protein